MVYLHIQYSVLYYIYIMHKMHSAPFAVLVNDGYNAHKFGSRKPDLLEPFYWNNDRWNRNFEIYVNHR